MPKAPAKKSSNKHPAPQDRVRFRALPPPETSGGRVLISHEECARRLGCHPNTLYRWKGSIPDFPRAIKLSPNHKAFYEDEIAAYVDSRPRI